MKDFCLYDKKTPAVFLVENNAFPGVKRIAERVADDIELVTGAKPALAASETDCRADTVVIAGTVGRSPLIDRFIREGRLTEGTLRSAREIYSLQRIMAPFGEESPVREALCIAGSDKRGTIYGLFRLSELCGVSPLVYWGDAVPEHRDELYISLDKSFFSKEPSVRYRGFFINDEWPAFGKWCTDSFGGVNAKAYEHVFELLLRLKGNYLWPAMWRTSFSEDGPDLESARLADEYGVIMGTSHHEPLCRAGVEWQQQYQKYGTDSTWSFTKNEQAITKFWEEGLLRNRDFENVITIGMRGEDDSLLLPEDATLKENIEVVKKAVVAQNRLIREHINERLEEVPRMIAIYKEVEDFYHGDETCEGLKNRDELRDVIFLLSDDNYGNLRSLPSEEDRRHPGGFGMYYHFDYHGAPVSYEWQNSTRLAKVWEQMTTAYEYGVREIWVVNVGDLKGVEYPLSYFMELAYDFEKWGSGAPNQTDAYTRQWLRAQFGSQVETEYGDELQQVLDGYSTWNSIRRPEAMNPFVYHPTHFMEGQRILKELDGHIKTADNLRKNLPARCLDAYESMIYYPAVTSFQLICMNIEAGLNHLLAGRGSMAANPVGRSAIGRIAESERLIREFHAWKDGKWNHMMESAHTGFRNWDDNDWTYPDIRQVTPIPAAKVIVGFRDSDRYHLGQHWQDSAPVCHDGFTDPNTGEILIDIDSRGSVDFRYEAACDREWLTLSPDCGEVNAIEEGRAVIRAACRRELLSGEDTALIHINIFFANGEKTVSTLAVKAAPAPLRDGQNRFIERRGYIAMDAGHFSKTHDVAESGWRCIRHLGRGIDAVKCFPCGRNRSEDSEKPGVTYRFSTEKGGRYSVEFHLSARNPDRMGGQMRFSFSLNGGSEQPLTSIGDDFFTEWQNHEWNYGVMNHIRIIKTTAEIPAGDSELTVYAGDAGIILERIVMYPESSPIPETYLGPVESWRS